MLKTSILAALVLFLAIADGRKCYETGPDPYKYSNYTSKECESGDSKCAKLVCDKDALKGKRMVTRGCQPAKYDCSDLIKAAASGCNVTLECYSCDSDNCNRADKVFVPFFAVLHFTVIAKFAL